MTTRITVCPRCSCSYTCKHGNLRKRIARIIPECNHTQCEECIAFAGFNTGQVPCRQPGCTTVVGWNNMDDFLPSVFLLGAVMYQREYRPPPPPDDRLVNFLPIQETQDTQNSGIISCQECESAAAASYCKSCGVNFCFKCFQEIHKTSKILSEHETSPVDTSQSQRKELKSAWIGQCKYHPGKSLEYVAEGSSMGCDECVIFGKLKGLAVTKIGEHKQQIREDLENGVKLGKNTLARMKSLHAQLNQEVNNIRKPQEEIFNRIKSHVLECHSKLEALEHRLIKKIEIEQRQQMFRNVGLAEAASKRILEVSNLIETAENALRDPSFSRYNVAQIVDLLSELKDEPCVMIKNEESFKPTLEIDPKFMEVLKTHLTISDATAPEIHVVPIYEDPLVVKDPVENKPEPLVVGCKSSDIITLNDSTENDENEPSLPTDGKICSPRNARPETDHVGESLDCMVSQYNVENQSKVCVSHIVSPGKFFIQKVCDLPSLIHLKNAMANLVLEAKPTENLVKEGDLIIARYDEDGQLYRARVLNVDKNGVDYFVQFIDYGNCACVNKKDTGVLYTRFKASPPFAKGCSLHGLVPTTGGKMANTWSPGSIESFTELTSNQLLHVLKMDELGDVSLVDLYTPAPSNDVIGSQVTIREILLFRNEAMLSPDWDASHPVNPIPDTTTRAKFFRLDILEKGKSYSVVVSDIVDLSQFSVQVMQVVGEKRIWGKCLEDLFEDMQDLYNDNDSNNKKLIYAPRVGMICAAKFSKDGKYYRAEVEAVHSNQQVTVRYVDFGNREVTDWRNLCMLFKRFAKVPALSVSVALSDIHPIGGTSFSQESVEALKDMTKYKELKMYIEEEQEEGLPLKVVLYETKVEKDICINAWIVKEGYASSTTGQYKVEYFKLDTNITTDKVDSLLIKESESKNKSVTERAKDLIIRKINEGKNKSVTERAKDLIIRKMDEGKNKSGNFKVTHVVTPSRIFVRNVDDADMIFQLTKKLSSWAKTSSSTTDFPWSVGTCCAARRDDMSWARAKIVELKQEESTTVATVYFYDFGKTETVDTRYIKNLEESFKKCPPLAKQTHLCDISPTGGTLRWSASACEKLKELLEPVDDEVRLKTEGEVVFDGERGINSQPVKLFIVETTDQGPLEPNKEIEVSVSNRLIGCGLALPTKNNESTVKRALFIKENLGINAKVIRMEKTVTFQSQAGNITETERTFDNIEDIGDTNHKLETKLEWDDTEKLEYKEFIGLATHVDWDCNVYLQTKDNQETMRLIKGILNSKYSGSHPKPHDLYWSPGQCCVVQFTLDSNWCRGLVLGADAESGEFEVEYVDFGNKEFVTAKEMRKDLFALNFPVQCFKLQLAGLVSTGYKDQWSKKVLDFIHEIIVDQFMKVTIESDLDQGFPVYGRLSTLAGVDIGELLVKNGYAKWIDKGVEGTSSGDGPLVNSENPQNGFPDLDQTQEQMESQMCLGDHPPDDSLICLGALPHDSSPVNSNMESGDHTAYVPIRESCRFKPLCLPYNIGDDFPMSLLEETSSDSIYCHLVASQEESSEHNAESFVKLSSNLQDVGDRQPLVQELKVGMSVIARYEEDRKWYRAEVLSCSPTSVFFVDFGNIGQVDEVRRLPSGMDLLPKQAILLRVVPSVKLDDPGVVSSEGLIRCRLIQVRKTLTPRSPVATVQILKWDS